MRRLFKKLVFKSYVIFLMAFTLWYGYFVFPLIFGFEGKEEAVESLAELTGFVSEDHELVAKAMGGGPEQTSTTDLGYRVIEQPYIEGRFHHIGFEIERDQASTCVRCHGNVPHDKSKDVRAFLNMHVFYVACETCHIRPQNGDPPWEFRWYDKGTGQPVANPPKLVEIENFYRGLEDYKKKYITYGNYGAKIAPGQTINGKFQFLNNETSMAAVERHLAESAQLSSVQKSKVQKVLHRRLNTEPMECDRCHNENNQYVPFARLGYPPRRIEELTRTAAVGMINKYKEFWIPELLQPRSSD